MTDFDMTEFRLPVFILNSLVFDYKFARFRVLAPRKCHELASVREKTSRIRGKFASMRVQTLLIRHNLTDAENKELYILGDVNCNLLPEASAYN